MSSIGIEGLVAGRRGTRADFFIPTRNSISLISEKTLIYLYQNFQMAVFKSHIAETFFLTEGSHHNFRPTSSSGMRLGYGTNGLARSLASSSSSSSSKSGTFRTTLWSTQWVPGADVSRLTS